MITSSPSFVEVQFVIRDAASREDMRNGVVGIEGCCCCCIGCTDADDDVLFLLFVVVLMCC